MNKPLDFRQFAELERIVSADLESMFAERQAGKRHGEPFSKRDAGRDRRAERKAARNAKSVWLNS